MQLGARWRAGEAPHRSVPISMHEAIHAAESHCPAKESWTLTWLEGRPRATLDDAVLVYLDAEGEVRSQKQTSGDDAEPEDDSWLD